ncbi:MAG: DUF5687 family protein, partial [Bacteroidota bacterium]
RIKMRFFLQKFPSLAIKPYLTLPVRKGQLAHLLLLRSLPSFFNVLPLFFILPFFFRTVLPTQSLAISLAWLVMALLLVLTSNFVSYFIDKSFGRRPVVAAGLLAGLVLLMYLDFSGYIELLALLQQGAMWMVAHPWGLFGILGFIVLLYRGLHLMFCRQLYLEGDGSGESVAEVSSMDISLFDRFGKPGEIMDLETKLIWRSNRARTFLYMSFFFLLYPLIFLGDDNWGSLPFMLVMSLLMTGSFTLNYAQLLLSWNSTHFDFILTSDLQIEDIFKGKYYLLIISNVILFVLTLPYVFVDTRYLLTNVAMMLFNSSWTIYIYMLIACYSSKRIDPSKKGVFNFEGFGAAHYLIIIPIIVVPLLLYLPLYMMDQALMGVVAIGLFGLLGILFREYIIRAIVGVFQKRKHFVAANFRKK